MSDNANNTVNTSVTTEDDHGLNARIFRVMIVVTGLAVLISSFISPWRTTAGLFIGGALA
jgi:hypothetical protein